MTDSGDRLWLDDQAPLDADATTRQIEGLRTLLGSSSRRVLDLGCGAGRILVPLVEAGHDMIGVDRSGAWLAECRARLGPRATNVELRESDWTEPEAMAGGPFDAVLCLGYSFSLIADIDDAVEFLARAQQVLKPGGMVVLDDLPGDLWPELAEGNWQAGISEDGSSQMLWDPDDAVFSVRYDEQVDPEGWTRRADDTPLRLWTLGTLRLAARLAGLSAPACETAWGLLVMRVDRG